MPNPVDRLSVNAIPFNSTDYTKSSQKAHRTNGMTWRMASPSTIRALWPTFGKWRGFPSGLAIMAMVLTWAVWYHTTEPGRPESAKPAGCSWNSWENCISLDLLNKMFTHGAIAGGSAGIWRYSMLRRERQAREAAERRAEAAERRVDEERQRADAERQQFRELIAAIREGRANPEA